jgi:hypothetical protein
MSRFDEDPADDRTELDLCIEEIKNLRNQLAAKDAEISNLKSLWNQYCECRDKHPQIVGEMFRTIDRAMNPEQYKGR